MKLKAQRVNHPLPNPPPSEGEGEGAGGAMIDAPSL
jgi:hypothetical protein